ncbi:MAG: MATE family efflux transporter [Lysobacterales bacterium 69-70]|nr:MATE family efflux transporter [Xanthomonadaceae bacterium]ODU35854.1 MAG: MATE family efflux transporter [Xanthomonadaceae bacterium SCN 69-320]ODV18357.1 MAG: MATE family efflux transporter [Xanthomonadaceae bacterium SCN 69-25]OJY97339.1 MAG: MATE family efflux transporter [Xanthomonadales bacterium 69-70]
MFRFDRQRLRRECADTVRLALPLVAGQLSGVGMTVIDTMLAGHLDAHTLGAVSVGANFWVLAFVAALGVMMALSPSVAQLSGARRDAEIGALFRQALWLAAGMGLVLFAAVRLAVPHFLAWIGVDPTLRADAQGFVRAISWGAPALCGYFALRGASEGMGLTRPTMYFGLFGLALLAPIGWALMYGRLGFAPYGAAGCGAATAIVLWLQFLALLGWLYWRPEYRRQQLFARWDRPDFAAIGQLLRIGVPMGVTVFMEASLFAVVALVLAGFGETTASSHQIALNVSAVCFMVPLGLALAITVRVGNAVGRGDERGVRYAGYAGIALCVMTQFVSASLMLLVPARIAALYTGDAAVIALAAQLLVLAGLFQFSDGVQVASNGALRGLKDTRVPMFITVLAYWGVGMPVGWFLAFPQGFGARGMWMGLIAGLSAAAVLLFLRFRRQAALGRWNAAPAMAAPSAADPRDNGV